MGERQREGDADNADPAGSGERAGRGEGQRADGDRFEFLLELPFDGRLELPVLGLVAVMHVEVVLHTDGA